MGTIIFVAILVLSILNVPIAFTIAMATVLGMFLGNAGNPASTPHIILYGMKSFPLMAIPLFVLCGELMNKGGISQKIVDFAECFVGSVRGGLAYVTTLAAMVMAGVSGSAVADSAALGAILIPAMKLAGIGAAFAGALVATAGTIGIIIPPSVPMVLFGVTVQQSIGALFLAGIIPGILVGISLMVVTYFKGRKDNWPTGDAKFSFTHTWQMFKETVWALIMPIIIVGGILGGFVTPTESAAIAAFYALIISFFIYKDIRVKDLPKILIDTGKSMAVVMIIVGTSQLLGWALTYERIPQMLTEFFIGLSSSRVVILLILNLILILAGVVLHGPAMIIVLAPIMMPIVTSLGMHPIQFGIIFIITVAIGGITPPVAACTFVASSLTGLPLMTISKEIFWLFVAMVVVLLLVTFVPSISLFIPSLFYGW